MTPKDVLLAGTEVLDVALGPAGFTFEFRGEGRGSGGHFAWGEYVRDGRRVELHFRASLGLVRYHVFDHSALHEAYMRALGVWNQCRYPGFSDNPLDAFVHLAADFRHAGDFLQGDALILRRVAAQEALRDAAANEELMAGYVGDTRSLEQMRILFHANSFGKVVEIFQKLEYPHRLSPADLKMVEIARRKLGG